MAPRLGIINEHLVRVCDTLQTLSPAISSSARRRKRCGNAQTELAWELSRQSTPLSHLRRRPKPTKRFNFSPAYTPLHGHSSPKASSYKCLGDAEVPEVGRSHVSCHCRFPKKGVTGKLDTRLRTIQTSQTSIRQASRVSSGFQKPVWGGLWQVGPHCRSCVRQKHL